MLHLVVMPELKRHAELDTTTTPPVIIIIDIERPLTVQSNMNFYATLHVAKAPPAVRRRTIIPRPQCYLQCTCRQRLGHAQIDTHPIPTMQQMWSAVEQWFQMYPSTMMNRFVDNASYKTLKRR